MLDAQREDVDSRPDPPILLVKPIIQRIPLLLGIHSNIVVLGHRPDQLRLVIQQLDRQGHGLKIYVLNDYLMRVVDFFKRDVDV